MQNEKREPELMDDAFDKLLDEFLADQMSSLEGDKPDAESCNDDKADEADDYDYDEDDICEDDICEDDDEEDDDCEDEDKDELEDMLIVSDIFVSGSGRKDGGGKPRPSIIYMGDGRSVLHIDIDYISFGSHGPVELRISSKSNPNLALVYHFEQSAFRQDDRGDIHFEVDVKDLLTNRNTQLNTTLRVELFDKQHQSIAYSLAKIAYVGSAMELLRINRIIMGNVSKGSNPLSMDVTTPYVQFAERGMEELAVIMTVNRRTDFSCEELNPHLRLITPSGERVSLLALVHSYEDELIGLYNSFTAVDVGGSWQRGTYLVELLLDDEVVARAPMTIGDNNIEGEVDVNNMLSSLRTSQSIHRQEGERKGSALKQLNAMAGLKGVKARVKHLGGMARLAEMRRKQGLPTPDLALHALFTGNAGTGKTTVAKLMGRIYRDMGLLSSGHVVVAERRTLTGRYYDSEARAVEQAIASARGGILFIDEAYMLNVKDDPRDPGHKVLEHLLTALADSSNRDWMLILAGYPKEMEELMNSNPGLKSRISNHFHFEDYNVEELMGIADIFCREQSYRLSAEARERLRTLVERDYAKREENFGNGRYVINLLEQGILPSLAQRVGRLKRPTAEALQLILPEDIPITAKEVEQHRRGEFDNEAIERALQRLDSLTGQHNVKRAIHNFVTFARHLRARGERFVGEGVLRWNFAGNSGMGKSTVAAILADILRAMGLIHRSDITEVRTSHLYASSDHRADQVLRSAVERARHGVLLIDNDAMNFRNVLGDSGVDPLQMHLNDISTESGSPGAIIIAECRATHHAMADNLARQGIYDYDHTLLFEDLNAEELMEILKCRLQRYNATMDAEAEAVMRHYIASLWATHNPQVANARTIKLLSRTIFEQVVLRECRTSRSKSPKPRRRQHRVRRCDVEPYRWMPTTKAIGYDL